MRHSLVFQIGFRSGKLAVVGKVAAGWLCRCDCGEAVTVAGPKLRDGLRKSCGCLRADKHAWAPITVDSSSLGVPLTNGEVAIIDANDIGKALTLIWYKTAGRYAMTKINGRFVLMHRLLLDVYDRREIDHIDGNGLNNRRTNLRTATRGENSRNVRKQSRTTTSMYKGVSWDGSRSKWQSYVDVDGKRLNLGRFLSEIDAARAHDLAAIEVHGEFARPNFPSQAAADVAEEGSIPF